MAQPDLPPEHNGSEEDKKETEPAPPQPTTLQRSKACFLKGVSYFSGDMEVFGKWMESKSSIGSSKHSFPDLHKGCFAVVPGFM